MRRSLPILLLVFTLTLAACSPAAPSALPPTQAPEASPTAPAPATTTGASGNQGKCTVIALMPTPGPTDASIFPAPSAADWIQGPETAAVTFLEYSDFQ